MQCEARLPAPGSQRRAGVPLDVEGPPPVERSLVFLPLHRILSFSFYVLTAEAEVFFCSPGRSLLRVGLRSGSASTVPRPVPFCYTPGQGPEFPPGRAGTGACSFLNI